MAIFFPNPFLYFLSSERITKPVFCFRFPPQFWETTVLCCKTKWNPTSLVKTSTPFIVFFCLFSAINSPSFCTRLRFIWIVEKHHDWGLRVGNAFVFFVYIYLYIYLHIYIYIQGGPQPVINEVKDTYEWPYTWVTGVMTLLIGIITTCITGSRPTLHKH